MVYLVSLMQKLFDDAESNSKYKTITIQESLDMMKDWKLVQFDTETSGRNPHICHLLSAQFGNDASDTRIVVDCETVDIREYKSILETKFIIGQNLKFDFQFLYEVGIVPRRCYDTMIVEQFLHLGYDPGLTLSPEDYVERGCTHPYHITAKKAKGDKVEKTWYVLSYALDAIAKNRLGVNLDKTVRGEITWRGLDDEVIIYGARDVTYLEQIMRSQLQDLSKIPNAKIGAKIECDFTPVVAYLEWCGIKLDEDKWKAKMAKDQRHLQESIEALNAFVLRHPVLKERYTHVDRQGDLFEGFNLEPQVNINWSSSDQVITVAKILGFNTKTIDKLTGEDKDSAMEKQLLSQTGINDEFLRLYFGEGKEGKPNYFPGYSGSAKVVSSFGQGHLDAINPKTGRIHTIYRAIGTISGRMSCGSKQPDTDLAKYKCLPEKRVKFPNMQQLPHDEETRACFVSEPGNLFCSCDYSAMEARIGADVYNEKMLLDEFLYRSGDTHAAYAKAVFSEELKDVPVEKVAELRPDLRSKVKSVEFAVQFGSDGTAVAPQLKIPVEEARQLVQNLLNGMTGLKRFKERSAKFVMANGYVEIMPQTGHRGYWFDFEHWKRVQANIDWEDYKANHKGTGDEMARFVSSHFKARSKWCDRMSLNLPTQGGGAVVLKCAMIKLYDWVIENGYWGKILFCNFTHDECNTEFPEELKDTYPKLVAQIMQEAAAQFYHKLPIPAKPEVELFWKH